VLKGQSKINHLPDVELCTSRRKGDQLRSPHYPTGYRYLQQGETESTDGLEAGWTLKLQGIQSDDKVRYYIL
jgi:hypothetical protein